MNVVYGFFVVSGALFWVLIVIGVLRRPKKTEQPAAPASANLSIVDEAERILRGEP